MHSSPKVYLHLNTYLNGINVKLKLKKVHVCRGLRATSKGLIVLDSILPYLLLAMGLTSEQQTTSWFHPDLPPAGNGPIQ